MIDLTQVLVEFELRASVAAAQGDHSARVAWSSAAAMLQAYRNGDSATLSQYLVHEAGSTDSSDDIDEVDERIFEYANRLGTCPYWEVDPEAVEEARGCAAAAADATGDSASDAAAADLDCGPFCAYLKDCTGYPGEYGLRCTHPRCGRILDMWFVG